MNLIRSRPINNNRGEFIKRKVRHESIDPEPQACCGLQLKEIDLSKIKNKKLIKEMKVLRSVRGLFQLSSHVWFIEKMTLLDPGSFWGVASGTQHWIMWSDGYQCIFKSTKSLRPKSKNHDNG